MRRCSRVRQHVAGLDRRAARLGDHDRAQTGVDIHESLIGQPFDEAGKGVVDGRQAVVAAEPFALTRVDLENAWPLGRTGALAIGGDRHQRTIARRDDLVVLEF